jgi:hypothetical protein
MSPQVRNTGEEKESFGIVSIEMAMELMGVKAIAPQKCIREEEELV